MASLIYDSYMFDVNANAIDPNTDVVYGMLVTSSYVPSKSGDTKRSNVTNEVVGAGYTTGGAVTTVTVNNDTTNNREDVSFANIAWPTATITAAGMVLYKHRGGASSADNLYAYVDFGGNVTCVAGTFTAVCSTPLRMQN
jgi:hypothetical protein